MRLFARYCFENEYEMQAEIGKTLGWIATLVGGASVINTLVRVFDIGLQPVFRELVSFYQKITMPIFDIIAAIPLPIMLNRQAFDIILIYLILLGLSFRSEFAIRKIVDTDYLWTVLDRVKFLKDPIHKMSLENRKRLNLALGTVYIVVLAPIWQLSPRRWLKVCQNAVDELGEKIDSLGEISDSFRSILLQIYSLPVAVILFFSLNYTFTNVLN